MTERKLVFVALFFTLCALFCFPAHGAEDAKREERELRRLMERAAAGGAPLSDAELEKVLAAFPPQEVDVNLVMLPVVVTDRRGRPLVGLDAGDFTVFEGGQERPISYFREEKTRAFRVGLLLDVSGSMIGDGVSAWIYTALRPLVRSLGPEDRMRLLSFSEGEVIERTDWTSRGMLLVQRAAAIPRGGKTAVVDALKAAPHFFPEAPRDRQALILLSDGIDNASTSTVQEVIDAARRVDVPLYVFALGGVDREIQAKKGQDGPILLLSKVAEQTGGRLFLIRDAETAEAAVERFLEDLRHQYWLAVEPLRPPDGTFRELEIKVRKRGAKLRTRLGYR